MRKLKLQMQVSIDGFISGPHGEMDWMTMDWDDDLKKIVTDMTNQVDCIVLGRKLAQGFIPYWAAHPTDEDDEAIDKMNNTPKVVFTKTIENSDWANTILAKGDLIEEITNLKNQMGNDIIVYGGGTFVSSLVKNGLIDEFNIFVNPVALGKGISIFEKLADRQELILETSKAFPCGIVLVRYHKAN